MKNSLKRGTLAALIAISAMLSGMAQANLPPGYTFTCVGTTGWYVGPHGWMSVNNHRNCSHP
jgi:hypothetical protein